MSTCQCHKSASTVTCEPGQLGVCRVEPNGTVHTRCYTPKSSHRNRVAMANWALEIVTGEHREAEQALTAADRRILESGLHRTPLGVVVSFTLPDERREGGEAL